MRVLNRELRCQEIARGPEQSNAILDQKPSVFHEEHRRSFVRGVFDERHCPHRALFSHIKPCDSNDTAGAEVLSGRIVFIVLNFSPEEQTIEWPSIVAGARAKMVFGTTALRGVTMSDVLAPYEGRTILDRVRIA
jgi:hypothetical protein